MRDLIGMMIGRDLSELFRKEPAPIGGTILQVRGVSAQGLLDDVSLTVRKGEIVGLAGLVGAGRTELARAIFGDLTIDSGSIAIDGKAIVGRHSPRAAIASGIGLVPEDRKEQGLVTELSVQQNVGMALLKSLSRLNVVNVRAERRLAEGYITRLAIKTPSVEQKTLYLSGGNQQRVVIAKWLALRPKVLIVDEPTRGIDVGATADIHALLCELAKQGMAILMISSDMAEILAMSDRILVMRQGRIEGELSREEATQERIMHLATGQLAEAS
jgi:ABC-type sugar transport system ATPase subunit